jgi:tetratricopeptide (TPR) repeat protein
MKKYFLVAASMLSVLAVNAQKDELKAASKALKKGDAATAVQALNPIAEVVKSADDKTKAAFYALYGQASLQLAQAGEGEFTPAIESYEAIVAMNASKYIEEANQALKTISNELVNAAVEAQQTSDYVLAADKLDLAYRLSPKDTIYLYYAAGSAVNGKDYDKALDIYIRLKEMNYDGSEKRFAAINIASSELEYFDKATRDLYVKAGTHKDPKDETTPSKRSEVVKNIALIYQQEGRNEEALAAYEDAIAQNPGDVALILNKANLYYTMGQPEKFKSLMIEASAMDPTNPDLQYNIGVIAMEQSNMEEARAAFYRALEIDPTYINASLNLSTTYINEGNSLIDQMNELAMSSKYSDLDKYDALKKQKEEFFIEGAKVLEASLENLPGNQELLNQLKNIYGALGDNANFKRILGMLEQ